MGNASNESKLTASLASKRKPITCLPLVTRCYKYDLSRIIRVNPRYNSAYISFATISFLNSFLPLSLPRTSAYLDHATRRIITKELKFFCYKSIRAVSARVEFGTTFWILFKVSLHGWEEKEVLTCVKVNVDCPMSREENARILISCVLCNSL